MTSKEAAELYRQAGFTAPADLATPDASKYRSRKKDVDGHLFDSTGEAEAYRLLRSWEAAGAITDLELQPVYVLQPAWKAQRAITYRPDFRYLLHCYGPDNGRQVVVDFKGFRTPVYRLKVKMFLKTFPGIMFQEWTKADLKKA